MPVSGPIPTFSAIFRLATHTNYDLSVGSIEGFMSDMLNRPIVLKLNSLWMRIGWCTPKQAFTAMCGGEYGGTLPAKGLSISTDENGEFVEGVALDWDEWVKLPIRECDFSISTGKQQVRVPSVIVSPQYSGMPRKAVSLTLDAIRRRDGDKCQVSGRKLRKGEGNLGHIQARAKGGKRTWENLVYMDAKLNTLQGTKTPEEMGWTLLSSPKQPLAAPACARITESQHQDHVPFIQ